MLPPNEATDGWYAGKKYYEFAAGRPSTVQTESALQFTQIVWKGETGKKVGFGVHKGVVYAWYCPAGNTPDTATAFKENVFPAGNQEHCFDGTVNVCYNRAAILAHDDAREQHGSPKFEKYDRTIAKAAQAHLEKTLGSCGKTFTGTKKNERPYDYRGCQENYYQDAARLAGELLPPDAATKHWLGGQEWWEYEKGAADPTASDLGKLQAN